MKLSVADLQNLSEIAISAAKNAGELINSYIDRKIEIKTKSGLESQASQVVTEVDVKAQETILETLSPTLNKYDLALLTEESEDDHSRFEKDYFWCIDPMDGTLAFTEKVHGFSVSIALVAKNGVPVIGVIYDPCTKNLYHAIKNLGVFKNGQIWQPELSPENNTCFHLYNDRSLLKHPLYDDIVSQLEQLLKRSGFQKLEIKSRAGAVLNACWVLEQAPACYFKIPKPQGGGGGLWDFAASACILTEAGAYAKSLDASPLDLNRKDSTFMNHKGVLFASSEQIAEQVRGVLKKLGIF